MLRKDVTVFQFNCWRQFPWEALNFFYFRKARGERTEKKNLVFMLLKEHSTTAAVTRED